MSVWTANVSSVGDRQVLSLEVESRCARGDQQVGHLRQRIDDLFGQAVGEVIVVGPAAHGDERQDSNRA